jgi:hypothetical protein
VNDLQIICPDQAALNAVWRMLSHVPEATWRTVEIYIGAEQLCTVIRNGEGVQTIIKPIEEQEHATSPGQFVF